MERARAQDRPGRVGAPGAQLCQEGNAEAALVGRAIAKVQGVRPSSRSRLYDPIIQALGVVTLVERPAEAESFAEFVLGEEGQAILRSSASHARVSAWRGAGRDANIKATPAMGRRKSSRPSHERPRPVLALAAGRCAGDVR